HVAGVFFRQEQALVQYDLHREPGVDLVEQQVAVCLPDHQRGDVGEIRSARHDNRVAGNAENNGGNCAGLVCVGNLHVEIAAAALYEGDVPGELTVIDQWFAAIERGACAAVLELLVVIVDQHQPPFQRALVDERRRETGLFHGVASGDGRGFRYFQCFD